MRATTVPAVRDMHGNGPSAHEAKVVHMNERQGSLSGLSPDEAKEFHGVFVTSFTAFMAVAVLAHILAWAWRPWGWHGSEASLVDGVKVAVLQLLPVLT